MNDGGYDEDRATTARLAYRLREAAGKEGVYYILRFPERWRLYAFPWDDFGDLWHGDVWRRYVVNDLAEAWAGKAKVTAEQLKPWWKGFPRGRIERMGIQDYTLFHADDIALKPESRASESSGLLSWPGAKCTGHLTRTNSRIRSTRPC